MPSTPMQIEAVLQSCPLFGGVQGDARKRLLNMAVTRNFRKDQVIFRQGQACPGLFIVGKGMVKIYKVAPTGREHVLHMVGPGHTFAEVAVLAGFACPADAAVVEAAQCVMLPTAALTTALKENHALCLQLLAGMGRWVHHVVALLENIVLRDAAARVAHYFLKSPVENEETVKLTMSKQQLANHLNLTGETLSRVLRRLTELGLVETVDRKHVRIIDRAGLAELSEGLWPRV